mmetsp:Transcript_9878/g.42008  ORF Transcript_9878/g.42008 Transcript_9878/m.42008 type:complete len:247 (+) Transcript_9878:543-1283(+)
MALGGELGRRKRRNKRRRPGDGPARNAARFFNPDAVLVFVRVPPAPVRGRRRGVQRLFGIRNPFGIPGIPRRALGGRRSRGGGVDAAEGDGEGRRLARRRVGTKEKTRSSSRRDETGLCGTRRRPDARRAVDRASREPRNRTPGIRNETGRGRFDGGKSRSAGDGAPANPPPPDRLRPGERARGHTSSSRREVAAESSGGGAFGVVVRGRNTGPPPTVVRASVHAAAVAGQVGGASACACAPVRRA